MLNLAAEWHVIKDPHEPRQEWQRLPRGDRPNHGKVISKAVAKVQARELPLVADRGSIDEDNRDRRANG